MELIIAGDRQSGKTTELIKYASERGLYVVVKDRKRALHLSSMARKLGYDNFLFPMTIKELPMKMTGNPYRMLVGKLVVDDVEDVLSAIFGMEIEAIAATTKSVDVRKSEVE